MRSTAQAHQQQPCAEQLCRGGVALCGLPGAPLQGGTTPACRLLYPQPHKSTGSCHLLRTGQIQFILPIRSLKVHLQTSCNSLLEEMLLSMMCVRPAASEVNSKLVGTELSPACPWTWNCHELWPAQAHQCSLQEWTTGTRAGDPPACGAQRAGKWLHQLLSLPQLCLLPLP